MKFHLVLIIVSVTLLSAFASDKGNCPPAPPRSVFAPPEKSAAPVARLDSTFLGTVTVLAVVSDTGTVCSAQIGNGTKDKQLNTDAVKTVSAFRFTPAKKNGRAVPTFISVNVHYWRDGQGNVIHDVAGAPISQHK